MTLTRDYIERQVAYRLTRYSPDEILTAKAALDRAEADYREATEAGWQALMPYRTSDLWFMDLDGVAKTLYFALSLDEISFDHGGTGNETFPLSVWRAHAARFRRQAGRIRRATAWVTMTPA